jgi:hypothetical protein
MPINDNVVKISILLDNGQYIDAMGQVQSTTRATAQSSEKMGETISKSGSRRQECFRARWLELLLLLRTRLYAPVKW